ncbi:hypothetical protein J2Y48_001703 [Mycoplana sp. BE70]|uniref:hypothetical protein n=1 Tax=Mycoplana sp. BE70 TaxID=2817775 RepID=UPI00285B5F7B|nr:hypothetical protein [Mycoplana sp. BE70]MDR6756413.1 hypothetical protein [Mycoplana sp. BE70]
MKSKLTPEDMDAFPPEDLKEIQRVFQKLCNERGFERGSDGASSLARSVLIYYGQGVRDTNTLEKVLRGTHPVTI